jgi:hypothetical protein
MNIKQYDADDLAFLKVLNTGAPELGMALNLQARALAQHYRRDKATEFLQEFLETYEGRKKLAGALLPALKKRLDERSLILKVSEIEYNQLGMASFKAQTDDYFFSSCQTGGPAMDEWEISVGHVVATEARIDPIHYSSTISYPKRMDGIDIEAPLIVGMTDLLDLENGLLVKALTKYAEKHVDRVWSGNAASMTVKILNSMPPNEQSNKKSILCGPQVFDCLKKITFGFDEITDLRLKHLQLKGSLFGIPTYVDKIFGNKIYFLPGSIGKVMQETDFIQVFSLPDVPFADSWNFKINRQILVTLNLGGVEVLIPDEFTEVKPVQFNRYNALTMKGFF